MANDDRYAAANERMVKRIVDHERLLGREPSESAARKRVAEMAERVQRERADRGADRPKRKGQAKPVWRNFRKVGRVDFRSLDPRRKREI